MPRRKNLRGHSVTVIAGAVLATVLGLGACGSLMAPPGSSNPGSEPTAANAKNAAASLKSLEVATQLSMSGYSRDRFHIWASQGGGCDTRDKVLQRQGTDVRTEANCKIVSGTWHSAYNDKDYTQPLQLQIDHIVPLANAWRAGAATWTDDQRKAFANDLTRPQLLAVDGSDNERKGDQDPSEWKPPNQDFWCDYAKDWITVKAYWKLTVTSAEKSALSDMLGTCA